MQGGRTVAQRQAPAQPLPGNRPAAPAAAWPESAKAATGGLPAVYAHRAGPSVTPLEIVDQRLHFRYLPPLRLDDSIGELATRGSLIRARSLVMIAMEWCGIIAFMYSTSPTVAWLLTSHSASTKTRALPA